MWFGAVAGVSTQAKEVPGLDGLVLSNHDTALVQMAYGDHHISALDQHIVAGKGDLTTCHATRLCQRVPKRWNAPVGGMIRCCIVCCDHSSLDGCQNRASETGKVVRWFGTDKRSCSNGCCFVSVIYRHKIDGIRGCKKLRAVAGYAVGWTILRQPPTREGKC